MTALRKKMIDDMQLNGLAARTQESYLLVVSQLARHYQKSPDQINEEELRQYFLYLSNDKHASRSTCTIALCGIKFFFQHTLGKEWKTFELVRPPKEKKLPVVLTSLFGNAGNYGLPLISFAFGQEALAYASVYFVTNAILINTAGVLIASLGRLNLKESLLGLLKVPATYAILVAMLMMRMDWQLPTPLARTVSLAANAAIPVILVLLGLELQRAEWTKNIRALGISAALRLLVGPFVGMGLSSLFGLNNAARQAGITEAAMPSAVMVTILASEYKLDSSLVTAIIFTSTLLSPLTLTPLLLYLGR